MLDNAPKETRSVPPRMRLVMVVVMVVVRAASLGEDAGRRSSAVST